MQSDVVAAAFHEMRARRPLVHNITNYVSMDIAANVLLAAGASPAMVHSTEEVAEFAALASAVVLNIGTLSPPWVEAMQVAARVAAANGTPWVLDPVAVGVTTYRTRTATDLLAQGPSVVRGNASEVLALAGATGSGKGVDSTHETEAALDAARSLAKDSGAVVAMTGPTDYVTDGDRVVGVDGGAPLMALVTALGCAASALVGAMCAVHDDPLEASATALAALAVAGERAARAAAGPGSLRWRLLDELHSLDGPALAAAARLR